MKIRFLSPIIVFSFVLVGTFIFTVIHSTNNPIQGNTVAIARRQGHSNDNSASAKTNLVVVRQSNTAHPPSVHSVASERQQIQPPPPQGLLSSLLRVMKASSNISEYEQDKALDDELAGLRSGDPALVEEALALLEEHDIPEIIIKALERNYPQEKNAYDKLFMLASHSQNAEYRGRLLTAVRFMPYTISSEAMAVLINNIDGYFENPTTLGHVEALNGIQLLGFNIDSDPSIAHQMLAWLSSTTDRELMDSVIRGLGGSKQKSVHYELVSYLSRDDIPTGIKADILESLSTSLILEKDHDLAQIYTPSIVKISERWNEDGLQKDDLRLISEAILSLGYRDLTKSIDLFDNIINHSKYELFRSNAIMSVGMMLNGDSALPYLIPIIMDKNQMPSSRKYAVTALNLHYRPAMREQLENVKPFVTGDLLTKIDEVLQNPHPPD